MALGPNWMPCWVLDDDTKPSSCAPDTNTGFSNWVLEEGEILSPRALGSGIESGQAWKVMEGLDCCCLVIKSYLTLCNPRDYSPPGSSVHWLFQARILEWVAFSFSRGSSWLRDRTHGSCIVRWVIYRWATSRGRYIGIEARVAGTANSPGGVKFWSNVSSLSFSFPSFSYFPWCNSTNACT